MTRKVKLNPARKLSAKQLKALSQSDLSDYIEARVDILEAKAAQSAAKVKALSAWEKKFARETERREKAARSMAAWLNQHPEAEELDITDDHTT